MIPVTEDITVYPYGERRLSKRLMRYWNELRQRRLMPEENDIDPDVLGEDWGYCFLVQTRDIDNVEDYNFTYLGRKILEAYFDGQVDEHNEFLVSPNAFRLSGHFENVIANMAPLIDEGEFFTLQGRCIFYRQVLLPIGSPSKGVEAIFGGMNYKIGE